jgi:hypothetical protein
MAGHDRFVADLRPLFERRRAGGAALCRHPHDLCTELIARELGSGSPTKAAADQAAPRRDLTSAGSGTNEAPKRASNPFAERSPAGD